MKSSLKELFIKNQNIQKRKESMIFKETKFAYRHKPTGEWVVFERLGYNVEMYLIDEFDADCLYKARNIIEEDLIRSTMNGERYAAQNFLEFELVEVEIEYKIK